MVSKIVNCFMNFFCIRMFCAKYLLQNFGTFRVTYILLYLSFRFIQYLQFIVTTTAPEFVRNRLAFLRGNFWRLCGKQLIKVPLADNQLKKYFEDYWTSYSNTVTGGYQTRTEPCPCFTVHPRNFTFELKIQQGGDNPY